MNSGFEGLSRPESTDWEEHSAVGDVSTGRRFKAVQSVPQKYREADTGTYTYYGFANWGTDTSTALWRILRETNATGAFDAADGNDLYDNVWDDRESLSYS